MMFVGVKKPYFLLFFCFIMLQPLLASQSNTTYFWSSIDNLEARAPWGEEDSGEWSSFDYHFDILGVRLRFYTDIMSVKEMIDSLNLYLDSYRKSPSERMWLNHTLWQSVKENITKMDSIYKEFVELGWALNLGTMFFTREDVESVRSYISSYSGWEADSFYNSNRELVHTFGMEPIICEEEDDNRTIEYVCGFRESMSVDDVISSLLNNDIFSRMGIFYSLITSASDIIIGFSAFRLHDLYIGSGSSIIKMAEYVYSIANKKKSSMVELYNNLTYIGYCELEDEGQTICSPIKPLCSKVEYETEKAYRNQSYFTYSLDFLRRFESSFPLEGWTGILNYKPQKWTYLVRSVINAEKFIKYYKDLYAEYSTALLDIDYRLNKSFKMVDDILDDIDRKISFYDRENYEKITTLVSEDAQEFDTSVARLYSLYKSSFETLRSNITNIKNSYSRRSYNYVYYSCVGLTEGIYNLQDLRGKVDRLKSYAESTTEYWKNEASRIVKEIENRNIDAPEVFEEYRKAQTSSKLGDKYEHYYNVYVLGSTVLSAYMEENDSVFNNTTILELYNYVMTLIDKAKDDKIDVREEEYKLDIIMNNPDADFVYSSLIDIKNSIIEKASIKYSDLPYLREQIYDIINRNPEAFTGLVAQLRSAEAGIVFDGYIDYEKGLGMLFELRQTYDEILKQLLNSSNAIELNYFVDIPPRLLLNDTTDFYLFVDIYNPNPVVIEGEENVELELPVSISQSANNINVRINEGVGYISYKLDPFERVNVRFNGSMMFGELIKGETLYYGNDYIIYKMDVYYPEIKLKNHLYQLPFNFDDRAYIEINGKNFSTNVISGRVIEEGYDMRVHYESGYTYNVTRTKPSIFDVGNKKEVRYKIIVNNPLQNVEYLVINLLSDEKNSEIESNVSFVKTDEYLLIEHPQVGENVFYVKYYIPADIGDDLENKFDDLLEDIENSNLTDEYKDYINDINESITAGDYSEALDKMRELEEEVKNKKKEKDKYSSYIYEVLENIKKEIKMIDDAISYKLKNDPFGIYNILNSRKEKIISIREDINKYLEKANYYGAYMVAKSYDKRKFELELYRLSKEVKSKKTEIMRKFYKMKINDENVINLSKKFDSIYISLRIKLANDYTVIAKLIDTYLDLENYIEKLYNNSESITSEKEKEFNESYKEMENILDYYRSLYDKAKSYGLEGLFPRKPEYYYNKLLKLPKGSHVAYTYSLKEMDRMKKELQEFISNLKKKASDDAKRSILLYKAARDSLSPDVVQVLDDLYNNLQKALEEGDFVSVIYYSNKLMEELSKYKFKKRVDWALIMVGAAVVGIIIFSYMYKSKLKDMFNKYFGNKNKEKNSLRKLKKFGED